jgi:hypothetical protein
MNKKFKLILIRKFHGDIIMNSYTRQIYTEL